MRTTAAVALAALSLTLVSCNEATTTPQEQLDESLATTLAGISVDPNAEITGGHTATPPSLSCSYDATTKWSTCTATQNGLTITRQMQFLNASGAQQRPDSTTTSMKARTAVTGTITFTAQQTGGPSGTTTVNRNSDETVTGLGPSSTQRVVNGTAGGTENSEGTDSRGTVTVTRVVMDTTTNLTLPSPPVPGAMFPTSGTIKRYVYASVKLNDGTPRTYTSQELHTFEPGGKLTVVTTMNGQTRTCVIQLGTKTKPTCTQG